MKIILMLLVFVCGYPQPPTYLYNKDFIEKDGIVQISPKQINIKNANEDFLPVKISFIATKEQFAYLAPDDFNTMISKANVSTMYAVKNKFTYIPRKIMIFFTEKQKRWNVSVEYTAENDYGGLKDGTAVSIFSLDGFFYDIIFI